MKYYIAKNSQQLGPMEPYEAAQLGITPDTLVWTEGMADWAPAGQIAEFSAYLSQQPYHPQTTINQRVNPQSGYQGNQYQQGAGIQQCPSTHLVMAILVTLFCCLPFGIVSIIYATKVEGPFYSGNYQLAQMNSNKAKNWAIAGIITGLVGGFLYVLFYVLLFAVL